MPRIVIPLAHVKCCGAEEKRCSERTDKAISNTKREGQISYSEIACIVCLPLTNIDHQTAYLLLETAISH